MTSIFFYFHAKKKLYRLQFCHCKQQNTTNIPEKGAFIETSKTFQKGMLKHGLRFRIMSLNVTKRSKQWFYKINDPK